jgi:hypothetical protein
MWRELTETDLAATLAQSEIDAYRRSGPLDGADPVVLLLDRTAALVRSWISCNGGVRLGPVKTIPEGLISPAMDYAAADLLKRIGRPLTEDRRRARERAEGLFEKIAQGVFKPESYNPGGDTDAADLTRPATAPSFAQPRPERLLD